MFKLEDFVNNLHLSFFLHINFRSPTEFSSIGVITSKSSTEALIFNSVKTESKPIKSYKFFFCSIPSLSDNEKDDCEATDEWGGDTTRAIKPAVVTLGKYNKKNANGLQNKPLMRRRFERRRSSISSTTKSNKNKIQNYIFIFWINLIHSKKKLFLVQTHLNHSLSNFYLYIFHSF